MRLTCPACGAVASANAWQNDTEARETLNAILRLPEPVVPRTLDYLELFRPPRGGMPWRQTRVLVGELAPLLTSGVVTWRGGPPRLCPPGVWARAMDAVEERGPTIRRPLRSHNYLQFIAYQLAGRLGDPSAPASGIPPADRRLIRATLDRLRPGWHEETEQLHDSRNNHPHSGSRQDV